MINVRGSKFFGLVATATVATSLVACTATSSGAPDPSTDPEMATLLELRQTSLAEMAENYGISDPPDVQLIRFVGANEWPQAQVDCLDLAGYPVSLMDDGEGLDFSGLPETQTQKDSPLSLALYTCEAQYSMDPRETQPLDDDQLSNLYDFYTEVQVPCLAEHGIETEAAPSRETFIETYFSPEGWLPYNSVDVTTISDAAWSELNKDCPQSTDLLSGG